MVIRPGPVARCARRLDRVFGEAAQQQDPVVGGHDVAVGVDDSAVVDADVIGFEPKRL